MGLASAMAVAQSAPGSDAAAMEREFKAAMAAEDSGDMAHAESLLLDLRTKHPGNFAVDESLGLLDVGREKFSAALPFLEDAAREQPDSDVAHANLGAVYFRLHRNKEALKEFERASQLNPANAETQQSLGALRMEAGNPAKAAEAFAAAVKLKPDDAEMELNLAQALKDAGMPTEARVALAALPGADASAPAQLLLGDMDEKESRFQQAAQHYARAVELDPSEANAWTLGCEFLRHWTFDAAIGEFEAARLKFPESTRMKLGLGAAYFGGAKYAEAVPVFADLLDADGGNALYAEMLGISCIAVVRENLPRCGALVTYAQAHPRDAKSATYAAAAIVAGVESEQKDALARKLLESAIAADPRFADAQYQMGLLKQNQSDWAGSVANLEAAIRLKPDFAKAHYRLALAYRRQGRRQDSEAEMALQEKFATQQEQDLDQRLRQITTFVVDVHNQTVINN